MFKRDKFAELQRAEKNVCSKDKRESQGGSHGREPSARLLYKANWQKERGSGKRSDPGEPDARVAKRKGGIPT